MKKILCGSVITILTLILISSITVKTDAEEGDGTTVNENVGKAKTNSGTADDTLEKEEEAIKIDGLNVAQIKELRAKSEKHVFEAEVSRMMNLIINSLYKNKEIFLRELISNASDALDKLRFLSLTDSNILGEITDMNIHIRADPDDNTLHITDTGIGMTKEDLLKNLGTIAKSGTHDFIEKITKAKTVTESNDLIGQFGVGFYSSFLVSRRVTVITKHNDDDQYIWESEGSSFSVIKDPRGNTLKRGTEVILHLKEGEIKTNLDATKLKSLIVKYSQFINFPIYLWSSKTEMVEDETLTDTTESKSESNKEDETGKSDEEATVEEEKDKTEKTPKKKVEKTVWDWELINNNKPIWTRNPSDVTDEEYNNFYKSFTKDSSDPLSKIHFRAEGEVTFNCMLFIPKAAPHDMFRKFAKGSLNMKLYVKRVFITDNFDHLMPTYLNFVNGIIDSDDLPLNVSRENLQQSKMFAMIKKKVVRKVVEMISKLSKEDFKIFWKEYSTNVKFGITDDHSNKSRLAKLLHFWSSNSIESMTSLKDYVSRMKVSQKVIYYVAGENKESLQKSPLVERVLKMGYEVLFLVDPIDEYTINTLSDFEEKTFQNLAKEGLELNEDSKSKEKKEMLTKDYEKLFTWLKEDILKDKIEKVLLSDRLDKSPCALVAPQWGYSGNMDRMMRSETYKKSGDARTGMLDTQKLILEVNSRHPLIKELNARMVSDKEDETTRNMARVLYDAAVLRSGYTIRDLPGFASRIEHMMRIGLNIPLSENIDEEVLEQEDEADTTSGSSSDTKSSPVEAEEDEGKNEETGKEEL